ncbi:hypothetical protein T484DRAFT_1599768, partial [Baffinella frigidus]
YTGTDGTACTPCGAGKWKSGTGSVACTSCGMNTYSTALTAIVSTTCSPCPTNTFSAVGSSVCTCITGYTAASNGVVCVPCGAGTYKTATGVGTCAVCDENSY